MQREGKIILRTVFEDGRPGDHMEIIVYEMNFDESDLNFHSEDVKLINGNFSFQYKTTDLT